MPSLTWLHEDQDLIAVAKPPGIAVIPGRGEAPETSLKAQLARELAERGEAGARVWVVHRLDRDVSGVLVFARNAAAHRTLSMAFEGGAVAKRYWALVDGRPEASEGLIDLALRTGGHAGRTVVDLRRGKPARTRFQVLERFAEFSVLKLIPETGRTHQLRVHLRAIGHPLAADRKYGKRATLGLAELLGRPPAAVAAGAAVAPLVARATLHAERLVLPGGLEIVAPLPEDLATALETLRRGA